jgi:Transcriptional regulators
MLDKRSPVPLYIQLKNELLDNIHKETWLAGEQIPTEQALMAQYGAGRATIRQAVSMLENEGYLCKRHGIGTFVARSQPSFGFEPLISFSYSLSAKGIHARNVITEKGIIDADDALRKRMRTDEPRLFYMRRLRYAENTPIAIEESYFCEAFKEIEAQHDLTGSLAKLLLKELGITIQKVEQVVVPRTPTSKEREIFGIREDVPVLDLERWIYIEGEANPFYYLDFIIPSNIYSLSGY